LEVDELYRVDSLKVMQTKTFSLIEALINVLTGWLVALATQLLVYPFFNINITLLANIKLSIIFVLVSLIRVYLIRRLFNYF